MLLFRLYNLVRIDRANVLLTARLHLLLANDWWELMLINRNSTYVEDFIIGAHGVIAPAVVALNDLLRIKVLLSERDIFVFLVCLLALLLFTLQQLVVVCRLPGRNQFLCRQASVRADLDITRVVAIAAAVSTQVIGQI